MDTIIEQNNKIMNDFGRRTYKELTGEKKVTDEEILGFYELADCHDIEIPESKRRSFIKMRLKKLDVLFYYRAATAEGFDDYISNWRDALYTVQGSEDRLELRMLFSHCLMSSYERAETVRDCCRAHKMTKDVFSIGCQATKCGKSDLVTMYAEMSRFAYIAGFKKATSLVKTGEDIRSIIFAFNSESASNFLDDKSEEETNELLCYEAAAKENFSSFADFFEAAMRERQGLDNRLELDMFFGYYLMNAYEKAETVEDCCRAYGLVEGIFLTRCQYAGMTGLVHLVGLRKATSLVEKEEDIELIESTFRLKGFLPRRETIKKFIASGREKLNEIK